MTAMTTTHALAKKCKNLLSTKQGKAMIITTLYNVTMENVVR
jgi:hypothetical protein